jgi:inner membrane protein
MEQEDKTIFDKFNTWMRNSITIRIISIGFLILILLIPAFMVRDLIDERRYRSEEANMEVSSTWGNSQTLNGPIVSVPYRKAYINDKKEVYTQIEYAHFLPSEIKVNGFVKPERRHRSIYDVVVYTADLTVDGTFESFSFKDWKIEEADILWDKAFISIGISDMRGITDNIMLKWNEEEYPFNPGIESSDILASGISTLIDLTGNRSQGTKKFSFHLGIRGSRDIYFVPLGRQNLIELRSDWGDPKFHGAFLPESHNITEKDFIANWKVLHLNRNYPQQWTGNQFNVTDSEFGVSLIIPVDHYQKSTRSAKYAIMIIAFTFLVFFFVEVLNKTRIHPIQYLLVGLALIIFYTLLLALSEHISFNLAYLISSLATISLVVFYANSIFKKLSLSLFTALTLIVLYGFIFVILQLQDYALLMGSIGLFIVMAVIMYLSRKIDWYNFKGGLS